MTAGQFFLLLRAAFDKLVKTMGKRRLCSIGQPLFLRRTGIGAGGRTVRRKVLFSKNGFVVPIVPVLGAGKVP